MNQPHSARAAGILRLAWRRGWAKALGFFGIVLFGLSIGSGSSFAGESNIDIELNKVEDNGGTCIASFVVRNGMADTLDRFSLDLFVFDGDGIIARQVLLDMAPLRGNKTTVAKFSLIERPCGEVGRILINNIPSCRSKETGETLDCLSGLAVSSRGKIELTK